MKHKKTIPSNRSWEINVRVNPESRLCECYDSTSIAKYPVAGFAKGHSDCMGMRVLDNFTEEHMM